MRSIKAGTIPAIAGWAFFLVLVFALDGGQAWAQRRPDIGQMTREAESARPAPQPPGRESGLTGPDSAAGPVREGGPSMLVRDFQVEGLGDVPVQNISAVLEPYKNRTLTMGQIEEAAGKVADQCRVRGYILAQAYLPPQDASRSGLITIQVVLGSYGEVSLDNKSLVRDSFLRSTLDNRLPPGQLIRQKDLERAVFLIGDLPGAQIPRLHLAPGPKPGTSNLLVETEPDRRLGGYFLVDNQGSRWTGRYRFNAGLDVNSIFGIGDKLSVYGLSTEKGHLTNIGLNFSLPLGTNGLRFNAGYGRVYYELGKEFEILEGKGWSDTFTGGLSFPLIRSSERNVWLNLTAAHKSLRDEIGLFDDVVKKKIFTVTLDVRHEAWHQIGGKMLNTNLRAGVTAGKLSIDDPDVARVNRLGEDTIGSFAYFDLDLSGRLALTANWSLEGSASFQKSLDRNLDSAEQFLVAGATGVQAYRETVSGDNGYLLKAKVRYRLPELTAGFDHSLGLFVEHGGWRYEDADWRGPGAKHSDTLSGVGFGYSIFYDPLVMNVQMVRTLGSWPDDMRYDGRTHIQASLGVFF
ncbi:MAG: hypothetical protein LBK52_04130 [Deltaproteobacteria bacterium]|nr:hypothetical protein [Deltaproteobacteria bacterium]